MKKNNVLFLSANEFGLEMFKHAKQCIDANFYVMTLSSDSKVVMYDSVKTEDWHQHCVSVFEVDSIRDDGVIELLSSLDLDLIVLSGWRQIIDEKILNLPKHGVVSFHPTPLPKGRGSAPIINSILEGWEESAVTMYFADAGIDSGDIIDQVAFSISKNDYARDVYKKCISAGKILIGRSFVRVLQGKAERVKQDESKATFLKKLKLSDNEIKFDDAPSLVMKKIRAFSEPYLGAFLLIDGKKIVIDRARAIQH